MPGEYGPSPEEMGVNIVSGNENVKPDPTREAYTDASERLDALGDKGVELLQLTLDSNSTEISEYLSEHPDLEPEGAHFLNVTLELRKRNLKTDTEIDIRNRNKAVEDRIVKK